MKKRLYVAYGSNLNISQMKNRCPTAKLYGSGVIEDYELQFKGRQNNAFATIAPKKGSVVPVMVWDIGTMDEKRLDCYEGYPSHYFKQDVTVKLENESLTAMVYIMNLKMRFGLPSPEYYQVVRDGYNDCGLDVAFLEYALQESTKNYYAAAITHHHSFMYEEADMEDEQEAEDEKMEESGSVSGRIQMW